MILGKDDAVRTKGTAAHASADRVECVAIIEDRAASLEDRLVTFDTLLDLVAQIDNASSTVVVLGADAG